MFIPRSVRSVTHLRLVFVAALSVLATTTVLGLNTDTHRLVNQRAVETSAAFDEYLRSKAGFPGGRETKLRARTIREWIEEGGIREDDVLRFLRHFHDPLKPWEIAGLDFSVDRHDSSVRWMQEPNQGGLDTGGFWSWRDARRLYYQALVESNPERQGDAVGRRVPRARPGHAPRGGRVSARAHTQRHAPARRVTSTSSYEYWVSGQHPTPPLEDAFVAKFLSAPIGFLPDILQLPAPPGEHIARVPIARLIDADMLQRQQSRRDQPYGRVRARRSRSVSAEIANANFYSENTFFGGIPRRWTRGWFASISTRPLAACGATGPGRLGWDCCRPIRFARNAPRRRMAPCRPHTPAWTAWSGARLPRTCCRARSATPAACSIISFAERCRSPVWSGPPAGITLSVRNDGAEEMEGTFEVSPGTSPGARWSAGAGWRAWRVVRLCCWVLAKNGRSRCPFRPRSCRRPRTSSSSRGVSASRRRRSPARCSPCRTSKSARPATTPTSSPPVRGCHHRAFRRPIQAASRSPSSPSPCGASGASSTIASAAPSRRTPGPIRPRASASR